MSSIFHFSYLNLNMSTDLLLNQPVFGVSFECSKGRSGLQMVRKRVPQFYSFHGRLGKRCFTKFGFTVTT